MNKNDLLKRVEIMASQRVMSKEELIVAFERGSRNATTENGEGESNISQLLYYIGGGIIFIGIAILIGQNWASLDSAMRILLTAGIGASFFINAVLARHGKETSRLAQAFFFAAGLLLPLGISVTFDAAGLLMREPGVQTAAALILFSGFLAAFAMYKESVLLLFTIIFGTWLYGALTGLLDDHVLRFDWRFECYRSLVIFVSYLSLGYHYFLYHKRPAIRGWLLGIGAFGTLAVTLALGGWKPNQSLFWEFFYPFITFGFIYWSTSLKSKAVLFFGASALVGYLGKITSEYFADSIGWPLTLVLLGFIIILIGYWAVYINKKYIAKGNV